MKLTLADKFIAWLTLFCGLCLSAVAIYYSVAGLVSIFAAAVVPIIIMGTVLEVSKLVATVWLKQNWFIAPRAIKAYLLVAIFLLMFITSMGIFGYLSKAHMDQNLVSGDVSAKISIFDEKIKIAKENIDANRKALKQLDDAVDQVMGRSTTEAGADKAVAIRRSQQKERGRLLAEIEAEQKKISKLNEEAAPIRAEVRKVEAEVGPIKYIAALIYGDNADHNMLESAVRWVIIMIVIVFDPLAVILLLASQYSFSWFRQQREEIKPEIKPEVANIKSSIFNNIKIEDNVEFVPAKEKRVEQTYLTKPWIDKVPGIKVPHQVYRPEPKVKTDTFVPTVTADEAFKGLPKAIEPISNEQIERQLDDELKSVKQEWKSANPDDTIKRQEKLKDLGVIDKLPWEEEPIEPKKKSNYMIKADKEQIKKTKD
jgi:hypothetical protein